MLSPETDVRWPRRPRAACSSSARHPTERSAVVYRFALRDDAGAFQTFGSPHALRRAATYRSPTLTCPASAWLIIVWLFLSFAASSACVRPALSRAARRSAPIDARAKSIASTVRGGVSPLRSLKYSALGRITYSLPSSFTSVVLFMGSPVAPRGLALGFWSPPSGAASFRLTPRRPRSGA